MSDRLYTLDFLRGIAIIPVVITHANSTLAPGGNLGVIVFFVVSGFLISQQLRKPNFSLWNFLLRRFCRIYLPAWASILLLIVMISLLPLSVKPTNDIMDIPFAYVLSYLFYNISAINSFSYSYSVQSLWSLHAEIWFYVSAAMFAACIYDKVRLILIGICLFLLLKMLNYELSIFVNFFPVVMCFLAGVAVERLSKYMQIPKLVTGMRILPIFMFLFCYLCVSSEPGDKFAMWIVSIGAALTILVSKVSPPPRLKAVEYIGVMSFSIYLLQGPFIDFRIWIDIQKFIPHPLDALYIFTTLSIALLLSSTLFYFFVEKPLSSLGRIQRPISK